MSTSSSALSRVVVALASLLLVVLLLVLAVNGVRAEESDADAALDEGVESIDPTAEPPTEAPPPTHDPFTLHEADLGAQSYEDLSPVEKEAADGAMEWAETQHGEAVHQAWSAATRAGVKYARSEEARRLAGLEGIESLGVIP